MACVIQKTLSSSLTNKYTSEKERLLSSVRSTQEAYSPKYVKEKEENERRRKEKVKAKGKDALKVKNAPLLEQRITLKTIER